MRPTAPSRCFGPRFGISLQQIVPSHFHNAWDIVAFALVASTLLKGIFDYCGTYLVNYAGFGMITDLRDDLYDAILRRSVSFFQQHATGTIVSTLINDIERVQFAMSSVLAEFLQQFFTLIFTACVVVALGGKLAWVLLLFVPVVLVSARRIGRQVRQTTRRGQDKLAEIQNILHETITGNRIVKAFNMELWEMMRFKQAARRLLRCQSSFGARPGHQFAADGYDWRGGHRLAALGWPQQHPHPRAHRRNLLCFHHRGFQAVRAGAQVRSLL